ncbi:uncharacterized protein METZ01_LOCUS428754 [marine metagenome]|uniref:FAD-binding PCMH-type domain-containing protein n=1 Tax=marine metagenome TaxID=408172 RepID=A0A382XYE7_9ZZZZ
MVGINSEQDGNYWRIGAMTTWQDLLETELPGCFDGLKAAARQVGGRQIQNCATIAGNLCNASPAADGVPPLLTLNARVVLQTQTRKRELPLSKFILGNRRTALEAGELLTDILIPKKLGQGRAGFLKLGAREYLVISVVMVAGLLFLDEHGKVRHAHISVGACSETAVSLSELEAELLGRRFSPNLVRSDHFQHLSAIDDHRGTAVYRLDAALTLTRRLLSELTA